MRSALYEWPFTMHLLWEFRCIIGALLEGIMGLMVAGDFATGLHKKQHQDCHGKHWHSRWLLL